MGRSARALGRNRFYVAAMTPNRLRCGRLSTDRHVIAASVLCLAALSACGSDSDSNLAPGLANPASVFCEEQGGSVEMETDDEGNQAGICVLADGSRVDEWEYYRDNNE